MKLSVRGHTYVSDGSEIIDTINNYKLWRLVSESGKDTTTSNNFFYFEAWLNTEEDRTSLFNDLKPFIFNYGGWIDWHKCTHDEANSEPCVIEETYRGGS